MNAPGYINIDFRLWIVVLLAALMGISSCSNDDGLMSSDHESRISISVQAKVLEQGQGDTIKTVLSFGGENIAWFNESTEELKFEENDVLRQFRENWTQYDYITISIDGVHLFTMPIIHAQMSCTYNDLVLIDYGYKYSLSQGYPHSGYADNKNIEKQAQSWQVFIRHLKEEGRYRRQN